MNFYEKLIQTRASRINSKFNIKFAFLIIFTRLKFAEIIC